MYRNCSLQALILFSILLVLPFYHSAAQDTPTVNAATLSQWAEEVSNWGRWGNHDEKGTLNLITPQKRVEAAALVRKGKTVSLAMPLSKVEGINNGDPLIHTVGTSGQWAGDTYTINYHGYAHSHIDALCHIAIDGKTYNGYPEEIRTENGAEKLGIQQMADGIVSRGVLVDIPWVKGLDYLEPGTPIMVEDLEAWERKTGIRVSSGDVLLIRTGRWVREQEKGPWNLGENASGLHASVAKWLRARDVAVLGSDAASDVLPSGVEGQSHPIHHLVLQAMGMPILDNLNLKDVAKEAQAYNRWEFLFMGAPLRIEGGRALL